jgi:hypothetical protein
MCSSSFVGRPSPNLQFEVKITRGSAVLSSVPFPGKFEAHTIMGAARDHGGDDFADLITPAAVANGAGGLGDPAVVMTPGAAVGGREDPEGRAESAAASARGAGLLFRTRPHAGSLADSAALHPANLDGRLHPLFRVLRRERQGEEKIGAAQGAAPWFPARDSQEGKELGAESGEYLLAIAETLEALCPQSLVTPLIIKRPPVAIAQHMVGFGYQLEPLLSADVAGIAVGMVAESKPAKATLDIVERRAPGNTENLIIVAVCLHVGSRARGNQKRPTRNRGAQYPMFLANRRRHITVAVPRTQPGIARFLGPNRYG